MIFGNISVVNDMKNRLSKITYENPGVEILTIEDVQYYEKNILKLHCSIYQI